MQQEMQAFIDAVVDCHRKLVAFLETFGREVKEAFAEAGCPEVGDEEGEPTIDEFMGMVTRRAASLHKAGFIGTGDEFVWGRW